MRGQWGTNEIRKLHDELGLEDGNDGLALQPDHVIVAAPPAFLRASSSSFHLGKRARWKSEDRIRTLAFRLLGIRRRAHNPSDVNGSGNGGRVNSRDPSAVTLDPNAGNVAVNSS